MGLTLMKLILSAAGLLCLSCTSATGGQSSECQQAERGGCRLRDGTHVEVEPDIFRDIVGRQEVGVHMLTMNDAANLRGRAAQEIVTEVHGVVVEVQSNEVNTR